MIDLLRANAQRSRRILLQTAIGAVLATLAVGTNGTEVRADHLPAGKSPLYAFCISGRCGLVDDAGNWRVAPLFSNLTRSGEYWVAERGSGLIGVLDGNGREIVSPRFVEIGLFADGLAPARDTERKEYGYIRPDGRWAIEPRYSIAAPFSEGVALATTHDAKTNLEMAELIDTSGRSVSKRTFAFSGERPRMKHGVMAVYVDQADDESRAALIDRDGQFIVSPRTDQTVDVGDDGAILVRTGHRHRLIDVQGNKLFEVVGEEASINLAGDELAFFSRDGFGLGVVFALTGAIVVKPTPRWVNGSRFSEGVAHIRLRLKPGTDEFGEGYIDHQGNERIAPLFSNAGDFQNGVAIAADAENRQGLIDTQGKWIRQPVADQSVSDYEDEAVRRETGVATPVTISRGMTYAGPKPYAAEKAEEARIRDMPIVSELLIDRRSPGASVRRHPCGIDIAVNRAGERVWPQNLIGQCADKQLSDVLGYDEDKLSSKALAAYRQYKKEEGREKAEWQFEVRERDKHTGSVFDMVTQRLYPEKAARDAESHRLLENAGWISGNQIVTISGPVSLDGNDKWKVLVPEKVTTLREAVRALFSQPLPLPPTYRDLQAQLAAGEIDQAEFDKRAQNIKSIFPEAFKAEEDAAKPDAARKQEEAEEFAERVAKIPTAFVGARDDRWQAVVATVDTGHFPLSAGSLKPEEILETLRRYGFWRNSSGLSMEMKGFSTYAWVVEPQVDLDAHIVRWAFSYGNVSTEKSAGIGYTNGVVAGLLVLGRTHTALVTTDWSGPFAEANALTYLDEIFAIGNAIHFAPGQQYADYRSGDKSAAQPLERFITGEPPENYVAFSRSIQSMLERQETDQRHRLIQGLGRLLGVLGVAIGAISRARRGKGGDAA